MQRTLEISSAVEIGHLSRQKAAHTNYRKSVLPDAVKLSTLYCRNAQKTSLKLKKARTCLKIDGRKYVRYTFILCSDVQHDHTSTTVTVAVFVFFALLQCYFNLYKRSFVQ